jgi:hypothetical protein
MIYRFSVVCSLTAVLPALFFKINPIRGESIPDERKTKSNGSGVFCSRFPGFRRPLDLQYPGY